MRKTQIAVWRLILIINSLAFSALAQIPLTDPPDSVPTRGSSATGQYALSQIESVNAGTGNVTLLIPLAHLPPGPGGFGAGVSLIYNSSLFDVQAQIPGTLYQYNYVSSAHGGGWNYGYKYTLWAQRRYPFDFNLSTQCQAIGTTGENAWFKNYLQTPDGSSHVLSLVATIQGGTVTSPPSTSIARDPNDAYWQYDVAGNTSQSCGLTNAPFSGTLVFASSDSTYIRVEATVNGGSGSWIAYFADGSQVIGASITSAGGHATDSDATQLIDRNGNGLSFGGNCAIGGACTETLTDLQNRSLTIQYASNASGTWTDTITWPGIHGNLTTSVDWASLTPDQSISYYPLVNPDGTTYTSFTENLAANLSPLPSVVNSIELPAASAGGPHSRLTFGYGSWGEVHSLTMSTGTSGSWTQQYSAAYTYCYDVGISCSLATYPRPPATAVNPIKNKVLTYTEVRNGVSNQTIPETTSYAILGPPNAFTYPQTGTIGNVTYPDGSFSQIFTANLCPTNFKSRDFCPALPYQIWNRDGSVTLMGWTSQTPPGSVSSSAIFNPYVQYTTITAPSFSVSKAAQTVQDPNGNPTTVSEFDWTPTSSVQQSGGTFVTSITGTPSRTTTAAYYQPSPNPAYWQLHGAPTYLRAKQSVMVNGTTCAAAAACSTYSYDQPLSTANLTQVQQYDSVTSSSITSTSAYLGNGNLQSQTDPNQVRTLVCYDGSNLYPTTRIVGATASANCSTLQKLPEARTTTYSIDFNSGLLASTSDSDNGITTTYAYDNIGRQTAAVQQPTSGSARSTTTTYNDVNPSMVTTSDNSPGPQLISAIDFDGLGRVIETHSGTGAASSWVDTAYAFDSSTHRTYEFASNPYFLQNSEIPTGWTRTTRDPAGRVVAVDHYSGATRPAPLGSNSNVTGTATMAYDTTTSGCTGPSVHATDEAGNMHQNCYDGLGRMTSVTEPNSTITNYTYNVLDNLATVDVAGQTSTTCTLNSVVHMRCFEYSTLSRLTKATNAESGAVSYVYDSNGNITTRTDAIGNITNFNSYDALNRPQSTTYTVAGTTTVATPSAFYTYDTDFKGALSSVCASMNTSSCTSPISTTSYTHDRFGRIATSTQTTASVPYLFSYSYSQGDELTHITYPSGRQVNYSLDGLGRVQTVQNGGTGSYYVSGVTYTAADGMSTMTMGNGVTQQVTWNDRLQPTNLQASSGANSLLALGFSPCSTGGTSCSTGNNGNLRQQTITAPSLSLTQTYSYDNLNRLTSAVETGGAGWTQNYGYDGNGNRALTFSSSNLPFVTNETPTGTSSYLATNRIIGYTYDAAGNVLQAGNTVRYFRYDAENRQVKACNGCSDVNTSPTATYTYDGDGLRVSKTANGQTTTYVYDAFGNLAAEYGQVEASPCGTLTCYLTVDHLGSTRLLTDSSGAAARRYDYLPFGQDLLAGMGARTTGLGYLSAADDSNPKFTGEVRDAETALDWLAIRAVSGAQGRFQSVDPANAGAYSADPQSWNGYSYVLNNPLTYTDPSGQFAEATATGASIGGPIGAGIGAAIDIGLALFGILGGGGGHIALPITSWELGPSRLPPFMSGTAADGQGWGDDFMDCRTTLKGCPPTSASPVGAVRDVAATVRGWGLYIGWDLIHVPLKRDPYDPKGRVLSGPAPENPLPFRLFGTYYCGPGGAGPSGGAVNGACKRHDDCYYNGGIDARGNTDRSVTWSPGQVAAAKSCNQTLYDDVKNSPGSGATLLQLWLLYGDNYGILHPGTAVHR